MFSLKRRWIWANQTGLSKARGHKKGQKRFWPGAAGQKWQKLAGCSSLPLSLSLSLRRARAHCCAQCSERERKAAKASQNRDEKNIIVH